MPLLSSQELRDTLRISRSTLYRLKQAGMPCIGGGRLTRYDQETALEWFCTHAHQLHTTTLLPPGEYACRTCSFTGIIAKPTRPGRCPQCGSTALPQRLD